MKDSQNRNCLYVENPAEAGRDPAAFASTHWNTRDCCLRTSVDRFPPYIDFAHYYMYPDLGAERYHMCGSLAESIFILAAAVNCSCLVSVDYKSDSELLSAVEVNQNSGIFNEFDLKLMGDYSYTHHKLLKHQDQHYPLGSVSVGSILGRENPTPPPGIRFVQLYTPAVWAGFWFSLAALSLPISLISYPAGLKLKYTTKFIKLQKSLWVRFCNLLQVTFLELLGIYVGQNLGPNIYWNNPKRAQLLGFLKNGLLFLWSFLSALILARCATADLLEILLYTDGTDRFQSMADLVSRTSASSKISSNFIVAYFTRSYLDYAIENGYVKLKCQTYKMINDDEVEYRILELLNYFKESAAAMVGVEATLTIIRQNYISVFGCTECKDFMYVQEDDSYSVPYYVTTVRDNWPADKRKTWRLTTARLLESGLSEFYYRRELFIQLPDFTKKKDQAAQEKANHKLKTMQISLWSIYTIVLVLVSLILLLGGSIMLWELRLHSAAT